MDNSVLLQINNLSAAYDGKQVLREVNLTLYERDYLGIIGPNGGGKTTLVKCMLGLLRPTGGTITSPAPVAMGYLPQYTSIDAKFPISVEEVVLSGLSSKKSLIARFTAEERARGREVIARMGLEGLEKRAIGTLSGGQLQRVLLGRAVIAGPRLLVLDEPATYIDKRFEAHLYQLLSELNRTCAIVLVSHDLDAVRRQARVVARVDGTLACRPAADIDREWMQG
ncbi:MAG: ATP-binding cassette domain-containing protein [Prevotellaceae bacterium]|jgi:zinc transport system ATP-binding protein|nr:ATP-binding cassette domain-containing protein [Prevotellaceae bacterium]